MEIRNYYNPTTSFGTKIPTEVRNKLFELAENPSAKTRARNDRKKAIIKEVTNKINELENSNSKFFELTILKNNKGKDYFGLKETNEKSYKTVEVATSDKRNLLSKFLSIKQELIRKAETEY